MTRPRYPSHITTGALALALAPAVWPGDAAAHTCDDPDAPVSLRAEPSTPGTSRSATTPPP